MRHVSLYEPNTKTLICGDAVHGDDVARINPFREGAGALQRALESLDKLAQLPVRRAYSGHGPEIEDFGAAVAAARSRYTKWLEDLEKSAWHGCKRIFAYTLIIGEDLSAEEVRPYLLGCPWFADYSRHGFGIEPEDLVEPLTRRCSVPEPPGGETDAWRLYRRTPLLPQAGSPALTGPKIGRKRQDEPTRNSPKKVVTTKGSTPAKNSEDASCCFGCC